MNFRYLLGGAQASASGLRSWAEGITSPLRQPPVGKGGTYGARDFTYSNRSYPGSKNHDILRDTSRPFRPPSTPLLVRRPRCILLVYSFFYPLLIAYIYIMPRDWDFHNLFSKLI